jgi:hypothetical protein
VTALTNAVATTLSAGGLAVGVGKTPTNTGTKPFVVIWPDGGMRESVTMKAGDGLAETWVCHCYGLTAESAAVALTRLNAAIVALHRSEVNGRTVQYPEQLSALPLSRDDDADPPLFDLTVEWRLTTTPA